MGEQLRNPEGITQSKEQTSLLEQYASATHTKILSSQSDIDTKDRVMEELLAWCRDQANIVVLKSGMILSFEPTSRTVQNCKSLMLSKGIHPGQVFAATQSLVSILLASGKRDDENKKQKGETSTHSA